MKTTLIIADDFLPDAAAVRARAVDSDFGTREFQGAHYKGVGGKGQPDCSARIARLLGVSAIAMALSFYRLGTPENEPTTFIHADRNCAEWGGVLYLNEPRDCRGGTAFWRHKVLQWDELIAASPSFCAGLDEEGNDESKWEMTSLAGMKFNRFVVYPSKFFHSRWPKEGWGSGSHNGRLIWTCFFDVR